jgi:Zn-dependent protease with chaperone function
MKKFLFFIILWIGLLSGIQAQNNWDGYTGIESEGVMPQSLQDIFAKEAKTPEDIYLKSLCEGGKIVYGSVLNRYLDAIMDNLLANNKQLRNTLSVFVVKSPVVNAYAMNQGFIFVNVGLLAQITNEAELAFILAHEIVHIADKHSIEPPKTVNLDSYLQYHNRSREQENEADRYALERYYATSKYSYKAMESAFDVLQYGYLPFDEIPFKRSMVETDFYSFDDNYFLENVKPIRNREDYIDTLSTHPNILKRRTAAQSIIASKNDDGRSAFVQSEDLFKEIQTLSRLECIHQYLTRHDYGNAYYNAYVLTGVMPGNKYLQNAMAMAVYGLSKHRQEGGLREVLPRSNTIEGEKQQVYHFFEKLTKQEFNVLAIRLLWNAYRQSPNDKTLLLMIEDAVKDMLTKNKFGLNDFSDYGMGVEIMEDAAMTVVDTLPPAEQNKYSRIKSTSAVTKVKPDQKFKTVNYMLVDIKQDADFVTLVERVKNKAEDDEILDALQSANQFNIGNNKLLVLDPSYRFMTEKTSTAIKKTLSGKKKLVKTVEKSAKNLDISTSRLSKKQLANFDTEEYNQYCKLMDWLEDIYSFNGNMVFYHNAGMNNVADDMNCQYAIVTSAVVRHGRFFTYGKIQDIILSVALCPVASPVYLVQFLLPSKTSETGCAIIEIGTGKIVYSKSQTVRNSASYEAFINAFIYDCLYDVKKGGKK